MITYWQPAHLVLDIEKVVGVFLISRYPQLSFLDIEYKNEQLIIVVDIDEAVINHQYQRLCDACLYYGCRKVRVKQSIWCIEHLATTFDQDACRIARCMLAKQLIMSLRDKANKELQSFIQSSAIQVISSLVTIDLRQIVSHFKYEISPTEELSHRALSTLGFVLRESNMLPGYNYAVYGDDSSVYVELDSHNICPNQLNYLLEWYGDDEGDIKTKHTVALSFRMII